MKEVVTIDTNLSIIHPRMGMEIKRESFGIILPYASKII